MNIETKFKIGGIKKNVVKVNPQLLWDAEDFNKN